MQGSGLMTRTGRFADRLEIVMKALSLSRGRLAADLGVDKSVVARWATGAVTPSEHNLAALTALVAGRQPGFTMLDWDRSPEALVALFGGESLAGPPRESGLGLLDPLLEQARLTTARRGATYEGFWRSTRPSVMMEGRFFHDHGMIRREDDGLLRFTVGGSGLLFQGWVLPAEGQLFVILYDTVGLTPIFLTFNGVPLQKASLLDGIVMAAALNAARTPSAYPIILERIGDLTGDRDVDDARCQDLLARDPLAPEGSIPEHIHNHLIRDVGPAAAAAGGDLFLLAPVTTTLSRGASAGGHLTG
jgi:transcriptional regulator with XRE-family HTH domain